MLATRLSPLFSVVIGLTLSACEGAPSDALSEDDVAAIRRASEAWVNAMLNGDFAAAVELFAVDGVVLPPNRPPIQGREAIRGW